MHIHVHAQVLRGVSVFEGLTIGQLQQLRDRMSTQSFARGESVIREGEPGSSFYVIVRGSATVRKLSKFTDGSSGKQDEVDVDVATLSELMPFGEAALINKCV